MSSQNDAQSGAVLLLVLLVVAAASIATLQAMRVVRVNVAGSGFFAGAARAQALALSAEYVARDLLARDLPDVDQLREDWAGLPELLEGMNKPLVTGEVHGTLEEESGKFPLPLLKSHDQEAAIAVFERLMVNAGFTQDAEAMAHALVDWQDEDDEAQDGEKESVYYYESQSSPIPNRVLHSLSELYLLRWPGQNLETYHTELRALGNGAGMESLLTPYEDAVNLGTAQHSVLAALPSDSARGESFALTVQDARDSENLPLDWYEGLAEDYGVTLPLKSEGNWFTLRVEVKSGAVGCRLVSVLERRSNGRVRTAYRLVQ